MKVKKGNKMKRHAVALQLSEQRYETLKRIAKDNGTNKVQVVYDWLDSVRDLKIIFRRNIEVEEHKKD